MKKDNTQLDEELKLADYNGKLEKYTIRAIRNYRTKQENKEKINKWSLGYYKANKEDINKRHGKHLTLKRIKAGKNVSQKTLEKYDITQEQVEQLKAE